MRRHLLLRTALTACLSVTVLLGCGGSGGSEGSAKPAGGGDEAAAAASGGGDVEPEGTSTPTDFPTEGLSFPEAMDASDLEAFSELQIALGVLGFDHAGYVSGRTIVAETTTSDMEDRQFTCIAAGQLDLDTYEVVVVDEAGEALDC